MASDVMLKQTDLPLMNGADRLSRMARNRAELFLTDNMMLGEEAASQGGVHTVRAMLTPAIAEILLENNAENRNLDERNSSSIARDIEAGNWVYNGEAIKVSLEGDLNDGQHRCHAVRLTGRAIDTLFVFGLPRESRMTLDQGKARTAGNFLTMSGAPNATSHAASATLILKHQRGNSLERDRSRTITKADIRKYVLDNVDDLQWGYHLAHGCGLLAAQSLLTAAAIILRDASNDPDAVETYIKSLVTGANLDVKSPIYIARQKLISIKGRRTTAARLETVVKGWNAWRTGRVIRQIACTNDIPTIEA